MINSLKKYSKYKESGTSWVGKIPEHWNMAPAMALFFPNKKKNIGLIENTVLSLSYGKIVIKPVEKLHGLVPESFETYQIIEPSDIIIRTTDLQNDHTSLRIAFSNYNGIITSAYLGLKIKDKEILKYRFGYQLLNVWDLSKAIYGYGSGLRQNLDFNHFKRMLLPLPPVDEQNTIIDFLDYASAKLETAIKSKKKIISVTKEQKKILIRNLLKPSVSSKKEWRNTRIKNEFLCLNTKRIPLSSVERGKMQERLYNYYGASGVIDKVDNYLFDDTLLLIAEDGANLVLRNLPLAIIASGKFWVNNHAHILKPKNGNIFFFSYLLEEIDYRPWITGAAQPKLTQDRLMAIRIQVPPLEVQNTLVEQIQKTTQPLDILIKKLTSEIDLLREYKTRLISDIVTGKLDTSEIRTYIKTASASNISDQTINGDYDNVELGITEELHEN